MWDECSASRRLRLCAILLLLCPQPPPNPPSPTPPPPGCPSEELYDLHVAAKLFASPHFDPARERLAAALLAMLLSRCYVAAHESLADTLFGLAAANWSAWHLTFLPAFVEAWLPCASASDKAALLTQFGSADLGANDFERALLAFLNDAAYLERTCS